MIQSEVSCGLFILSGCLRKVNCIRLGNWIFFLLFYLCKKSLLTKLARDHTARTAVFVRTSHTVNTLGLHLRLIRCTDVADIPGIYCIHKLKLNFVNGNLPALRLF